jgi:hypothetical protein
LYNAYFPELFRFIVSIFVGIATGCGFGGQGSILAVHHFSLLHGVQTESGAHLATYAMVTRGKAAGA